MAAQPATLASTPLQTALGTDCHAHIALEEPSAARLGACPAHRVIRDTYLVTIELDASDAAWGRRLQLIKRSVPHVAHVHTRLQAIPATRVLFQGLSLQIILPVRSAKLERLQTPTVLRVSCVADRPSVRMVPLATIVMNRMLLTLCTKAALAATLDVVAVSTGSPVLPVPMATSR